MKRILLAGATLLALTAAQPTLAADAPVDRKGPAPVAVEPTVNWAGLYVGGVVGYGWGRSTHCDDGSCLPGYPEFGITGWTGGGTLGFNWQPSNWVYGIEADWSWAGIRGSSPDTGNFGCGTSCNTDVTSVATIRGRVGYAFNRLLPYVTAGIALSHLRASIGNPILSESTTTKTSFTAGVGVEYAFAPQWSGKLEYLYVGDLGDFNYDVNSACGGPPNCFARTGSISIVRFGVNHRFASGR